MSSQKLSLTSFAYADTKMCYWGQGVYLRSDKKEAQMRAWKTRGKTENPVEDDY